MRKLFITMAIMTVCATTLSAQRNSREDVVYYGIDFSRTKTYGAKESAMQFYAAFSDINELIINEWPKYNPEKFLNINVIASDISVTVRLNDEIEPSAIPSIVSDYVISEEEVAEMVAMYELLESEGTGLVIIGELLDKSKVTGYYTIVCFDIATREILYYYPSAGKAGGFGLRNYWAGALLNAMKNIK